MPGPRSATSMPDVLLAGAHATSMSCRLRSRSGWHFRSRLLIAWASSWRWPNKRHRAGRAIESKRRAPLFGQRIVHFGQLGGELADIEPGELVAPGQRFGPADFQNRGQDPHQRVGLADDAPEQLFLLGRIVRLRAAAWAAERSRLTGERRSWARLSVSSRSSSISALIRSSIALIWRPEPVERVAGAGDRHALRQVARADAVGDGSNVADPPPDIMGEDDSAEQPQQPGDDQRDKQRPLERVADREAFTGQAPADQPFAGREPVMTSAASCGVVWPRSRMRALRYPSCSELDRRVASRLPSSSRPSDSTSATAVCGSA